MDATSSKKIKILIIGAGPAGLSVIKALKQLEPEDKYEIVCYDKQSDWGGQWNFSWRTGVDKHGELVHSSMYSQLWTNIPKECLEFPDYTFKEHYGKSTPSYLPRDWFKNYFMTRFEKAGVKKYLRFNRSVRNVKYLKEKDQFEVRITNIVENTDTIEMFDYVTVANGHFSVPNFPEVPSGLENFNGRVVHTHDVKEFNQFKGQRVMLIGGSLSSEDFALQCYKYGAKSILWTYKNIKFTYNEKTVPENIEMRTMANHVDGSKVFFENGDEREIDTIIFCTGYIHNFPFMEEDIRLKCASINAAYPPNLYRSLVLRQNPKVFYVGMGNYTISQLIFDIQGYLIRDIISGKHQLPSMEETFETDLQREEDRKSFDTVVNVLNSVCRYARELITLTDYPDYKIEEVIPMFDRCMKERGEDMLRYRDIGGFCSVITGQESCVGKVKWLDIRDSEEYNKPGKENSELKEYFSLSESNK